MNSSVTPEELAAVRTAQRRLLRVAGVATVGAVAALVLLALSASAAASGPPAISVVGWDPERGATTVWRGLTELRESRLLPGARVPTLALLVVLGPSGSLAEHGVSLEHPRRVAR